MEQLQVGSQQSGKPRNMRGAFETSARVSCRKLYPEAELTLKRMMRELWRTTGQLTELPRQSPSNVRNSTDGLDEVTFDFKIFYTDDTPEE